MRKIVSTLAITLSIIFTAGITKAEPNDPLEGINRKIDYFNTAVDSTILKPISKGYKFITPKYVRLGISNIFDNLFYPKVIINQALQGNFKLAGKDTARFLLNTTMGIGGLFDVADEAGLYAHKEDFGQTLSVWTGMRGPYIVLPIFGSSTGLDAMGRFADIYTSPIMYLKNNNEKNIALGLAFVDARYRLFKAETLVSGDKYIFIRDAYLQKREFLIKNGKVEESDPFLDEE